MQQKAETFTFRLDAGLKAALHDCANDENLAPAELLRSLVQRHVDDRARLAFEQEARRQALVIAGQADETAVLEQLGAELDSDAFARSWTP